MYSKKKTRRRVELAKADNTGTIQQEVSNEQTVNRRENKIYDNNPQT